MAVTAKWLTYNTADTAVASASLNALASGSYALGAAIDNTVTSNGFLYGDLELVLSSAITSGTGSPYVGVYLLPTMDGTNYPTPPGGTAGATGFQYFVGSMATPASTSTQVLHLRGILLPPQSFKIMIQNVLGAALPSTNTSTCKLYRYGEQAV